MGLWQDFKDTVHNTYVADGVDLINRTQNDSQDLFRDKKAKKYRSHWGTITLHALGFPTRQLDPSIKRPTFQNFRRNWIGWNPTSSTPAKVARAILMGVLVNPILLIPRAVVGIAKVVTEVIPGTLSRFVLNVGDGIVNFGKGKVSRAFADETTYPDDEQKGGLAKFFTGAVGVLAIGFGAVVWAAGAVVKSVYLTLCTLTSPIETVRASYHYGKNPIAVPFTYGDKEEGQLNRHSRKDYSYIQPGKPLGFILAGFAVVGSIITFALTGPFALKALTAALAPIAGGKIANAVASVEKIGNVKFIGPILTKIGEGFQKVASLPYISNVLNYLHIGSTIQAAPAALIGLGAVVGGLISTVGTIVNEFPYKKPWLRFWHRTSKVSPGFSTGQDDAELLLPPAIEADANAGMQSPPTLRSANVNLGEGSGTKPLFAVKSRVGGSVPAATPTAAIEHTASLRV